MSKAIAVLGAGPMGLACAYQLIKDGYTPIVFEADDRVGGMSASFDFNGLMLERYYHFHCTSDHDFLQILDELELKDNLRWTATKMGYWYQNKLQPWGNPQALIKFKGLSLLAKFRYGIHAFLATKRSKWQDLDDKNAVTWIKRWVGAEAYAVLWQKLFDYKFYAYAENLSAAWIWSRIRRIGRSRYNIFKEKLGYLDGGSETLLQALKTAIEAGGGKIYLQTPVSKVVIADGLVKGIEIAGNFQPFTKVISTIPLPYVPRLMPDLPLEILHAFQAIENIAVVCIVVKLKKAVSENFWLNINDPDMDIPGLVEYSNLRNLAQHVVYVPFYMPAEHPKFQEPDEAFINKVRIYIKKINPDISDKDFIDIKASRYRHAQPICPPGFLTKLPDFALPIKGLWVADTSYYYPEDRGISESIGFGRKMARSAATKSAQQDTSDETHATEPRA
jgi:protoporphyrinogen oxidase